MPITHAKGYAIHDTKKYTDFKVTEYPLKTEEPYDVTIKVECCGCVSYRHVARNSADIIGPVVFAEATTTLLAADGVLSPVTSALLATRSSARLSR